MTRYHIHIRTFLKWRKLLKWFIFSWNIFTFIYNLASILAPNYKNTDAAPSKYLNAASKERQGEKDRGGEWEGGGLKVMVYGSVLTP